MAVGDWIANLFQSDETRGLSGGAAGAVALDDSNPYYNYRLRRHSADGDLVREPQLLWHTSSHVKRRAGLGIHIAADKGEGVASFTDVLLILSAADYKEALGGDPQGGWLQKASLTLLQEFEDYCKRQGFSRLYDHRQLGFKIMCDGSEEMGGQLLDLDKGEFITGLLPNLYTGPVRGSRPVIGVHVNLPGAWEGYREVGRLYNDQILFTLGNHWLDNFSDPHLREAALYRLQQYPDGGTVHIINPDLQGRYQVTATDQGGASVLTIATRDGEPLAYLVLAVIEEEAAVEGEAPPVKPGIAMPTSPKPTSKEGGYTIPPPMVLEEGAEAKRAAPGAGSLNRQAVGMVAGHKTIIPDAVEDRIFTLQERGALLQKVHFGAFMEGYDVYVGQRGDMGTAVEDPAAIFQVRRRSVTFVSNVIDAKIDNEAVEPGEEIQISKDLTIEVAGQKFEYRDLRGETADGWPYVGEIRRPTSSNYIMWGDNYQIGRSRECRVVLPDEPRNDNIHWKAKVGDGDTIRARTGEIPKSRFYTDSIMVASEHGEIDLGGDDPRVRCTARHCYVYIRRGTEVLPLFPTKSGKEPLEMLVEPDDEVLIGNCLFKVGFTPVEEAVATAPGPDIDLSADSLVESVSAPDLAELQQPPPTQEPPAAAGLGEKKGPAPEPLPVEATDADSILGTPVAADDQAS
ncbi:MAG: hypothetical protein JRJ84_17285, partial [Deltaproteobacteria bacterium]|nr:hypothetical protein [Deltaproteobacteria bacterium]